MCRTATTNGSSHPVSYFVTLYRKAYNDHRIDYVALQIRGGKATVETLVVSGKIRTPMTYKLARVRTENTQRRWPAYDVVVMGC